MVVHHADSRITGGKLPCQLTEFTNIINYSKKIYMNNQSKIDKNIIVVDNNIYVLARLRLLDPINI
jgi:hypothetical protein